MASASVAAHDPLHSDVLRSHPVRVQGTSCAEVFVLRVPLPDVVAMQNRQPHLEGAGEIPLRRLVSEALRMRPSRIVVGEVRQEECLDLTHHGSTHAGQRRSTPSRIPPGTSITRRQQPPCPAPASRAASVPPSPRHTRVGGRPSLRNECARTVSVVPLCVAGAHDQLVAHVEERGSRRRRACPTVADPPSRTHNVKEWTPLTTTADHTDDCRFLHPPWETGHTPTTGVEMEPVSLLLAALAAGVGAGVQDIAGSAVRDAYAKLREVLRRRFAGRPAAEEALAEHEKDPKAYEPLLRKYVTETGADRDAEVLELAERVLALADSAGSAAGKYRVDAAHAQGVQVGDRNQQINTFGAG